MATERRIMTFFYALTAPAVGISPRGCRQPVRGNRIAFQAVLF